MTRKNYKFLVDIYSIVMGGVCTIIKIKNKNTGHEFVECIKRIEYMRGIITYVKNTTVKYGGHTFEDKYINFDKLLRVKDIYIDVIEVNSESVEYDDYVETHSIRD